MRAVFPKERLGWPDYVFGGLLLVFCYFAFFHGDIRGVGWDSLNYLFGNPMDFYENCKMIRGRGTNMLGTPYPPTVYLIFAMWQWPFKLFGAILNAWDVTPVYLVYWLKLLPVLVYAASGLVLHSIARACGMGKDASKYTAILWLALPLALYSQFIFSQYDIFYTALTMLGFLFFLRGRLVYAALVCGVAMTFKYFPCFVFIPLLLLFEKRILRIAFYLAVLVLPTLLIYFLYGSSPAYVEGVLHHNAIDRIYAQLIAVGSWKVCGLFAVFTFICGWAYFLEPKKEKITSVAAYLWLVSATFPFLLIEWHPQWLMFLCPAMALTSVMLGRLDRFAVLDLVGMLFFIGFTSIVWKNNVDAYMFHLGHFWGQTYIIGPYSMADYFELFRDHSRWVFFSVFWGYLVLHLALKARLCFAAPGSGSTGFNYHHIRALFFGGLLIFLVPALLTVHKNMGPVLVSNIMSEKVFGKLAGAREFDQSFVARGNYITRVELRLATFAMPLRGTAFFAITGPNKTIVYNRKIDLKKVMDNSWFGIDTGEVPVVPGGKYMLRLAFPEGTEGNALTWWASKGDTYANGTAIVDNVPQDSDFCFKIRFTH